jgi:hypothetical protein
MVSSSSWPGMTDLHQPSLGWPGSRPHASNRILVTVVRQGAVGWRRAGLRQDRAAKATGESGGGGGESAGVVDLSSEELNTNGVYNYV